MSAVYSDDWLTVLQGDCRAVMASMEPESVHCVVTSPPYWGLRDYGTAAWEGGEEGCDHLISRANHGHAGDIGERNADGNAFRNSARYVDQGEMPKDGNCRRCGARRIDNQLGLEPTPEEYVANLVDVFREVRRVLRSDGTVWLNLGDSYNSLASNQRNDLIGGWNAGMGRATTLAPGLKPKDLVGIPWRVAFALQADGWYLRSDIIWSKPNPMPESVTDRPTKSHEYLFLLSKSPRYYFDADAVREGDSGTDHPRAILTGPSLEPSGGLAGPHTGIRTPDGRNGSGRNIRSVWTIATQPYPGAHFATFPRKLVEPCIKAGTSERGVCPECGAPWERVVERVGLRELRVGDTAPKHQARTEMGLRSAKSGLGGSNNHSDSMPQSPTVTTTGWQPSCAHDAEPIPATVLDLFAGSGTTGLVAQSLSRRAILIDLNADYLIQAMGRNRDIPLGLAG